MPRPAPATGSSQAPDADRERCLRSWIAVLAVLGAAAHVGAAAMASHAFAPMLVFVGMGVLCLPCALHVWRYDSRRSQVLFGLIAAGMVVVHLLLMALIDKGATVGHSAAADTAHASLAMLAVVECGVAAGAWCAARQPNRPRLESRSKESPWPT